MSSHLMAGSHQITVHFYLTQCLFLHYLGKTKPTKYCIFVKQSIIT